MLRAILVDDEPRGLSALKLLVERFCPDVKIVANCTSPIDAIEQINSYHPEIVFLDINMPEMNGFDLLSKLEWNKFHLIFTTAHQEFALKALKSNALDYLLKPIDKIELNRAIEKAKKKIEQNDDTQNLMRIENFLQDLKFEHFGKIKVHSRYGIDAIEPSTIICLESKSNYTHFFIEDREPLISTRGLKDYDFILCANKNYFMRVHNSFIVNLRKVLRYIRTTDTIIMNSGQKIPISKSRKEEFIKWLGL